MTMDSFRWSVVVAVLAVLVAGQAFAQTPAAQPSFPATSFLTPTKATWDSTRTLVLGIVEVMPEDKYDFKPTPESRSVAQTLAHIATLTTFQMMLHGERIPIEKIDFTEYLKTVAAEEARLKT